MTQERDDKQAPDEPEAQEPAPVADVPGDAAAEPDGSPQGADAEGAVPVPEEGVAAEPGEKPASSGETDSPEPEAPMPVKKVGTGRAVFAAVVTTVLVLALAGLTAYATWPQWRGPVLGQTGQRLDAVTGRVDALDQRLGDLAEQVAALQDGLAAVRQRLEAAPAADSGAGLAGAVEDLAARVAALETAVQDRATGTAAAEPAMNRRLEALERRVEDLAPADPALVSALARENERLSEAVDALRQQLAALEGRAADASAVLRLSERVDAVAATAQQAMRTRSDAQALLLAVAQLHVAVETGRDYGAELRTVRTLAPEDEAVQAAIETLARHVDGIPTRSVLAASLDDLAPDIVRASIGPEEEGWWRETVQRMAALVSIKRTDDGGEDSVPALVARAERAVDHGDLAQAVALLERLEGPPAAAAAPWLAAARAHVQAQAALGDLASRAIAIAGAEERSAAE